MRGLEGNTMAQPRVFGHDVKQIVVGAIDNSNPNIFTNFTIGTEGYDNSGAISTTGGGGTGLTVTGISKGEIAALPGNITITAAGTGYSAGTSIDLTGGSGTGAKANIAVTGGGTINAINISDLGSKGYLIGDLLEVSGGNGDAKVTVAGLVLTGVTISAVGSGYTVPTLAAPQVITLAGGIGAGTDTTFRLAQDVAVNIPFTQQRGALVYNNHTAAQDISVTTEGGTIAVFKTVPVAEYVGFTQPILAVSINSGINCFAIY